MLEIVIWRRALVLNNMYFPGNRICAIPFKAAAICFTIDSEDFFYAVAFYICEYKIGFSKLRQCWLFFAWGLQAHLPLPDRPVPCHVMCGPR